MDAKKARTLLRKFNVFQTWRLGEPPFDKRPDMYSDKDVNNLFDEVSEALAGYVAMCDGGLYGLPSMPPGFPTELPSGVTFINAKELVDGSLKSSSSAVDPSSRWAELTAVAQDDGKQPPPPLPPAPFREQSPFIVDE